MKKIILFSLLISFFPYESFAQQLVGTYNSWKAYTVTQNNRKLCYMVSSPTRKSGNYTRRGQPYAMVTHINANRDEFSVTGGYPYMRNTKPRVHINGTKRLLGITKGEIAWAESASLDREFVNAMKMGRNMRIIGTSTRGTYSIDNYSLIGFTNAYNSMKRACRGSDLGI